jgi:hypothetical protein
MRALNRHVERVFNPDRKEHHCGRRKLARDRQNPNSCAACARLLLSASNPARVCSPARTASSFSIFDLF